ncbi:hypothetical protein KIL84_011216 [Mauremys mutica]|uniref:Uncharacterized protein n=1 Tax=Mauremys mutica TaxID=74926 RepID=A0A9D3XBM0_9SAUR|nr:hypothetical protein KIL84_011216 [Mauremys mutica]
MGRGCQRVRRLGPGSTSLPRSRQSLGPGPPKESGSGHVGEGGCRRTAGGAPSVHSRTAMPGWSGHSDRGTPAARGTAPNPAPSARLHPGGGGICVGGGKNMAAPSAKAEAGRSA